MSARGRSHRPAAAAAPAVVEQVVALAGRDPRAALQLARRTLGGPTARSGEPRARLLRAYGHALRGVGDYAAARIAYRGSRRILARLGRELECALGAIGLIDACMYLGLSDEAVAAADEARAVFQRAGDRRRMAMIETNLGNLFHRMDQLETALAHYGRAARLLAESGSDVERAMVDHNLANVFILLGRRDEAESAFQRACVTFERHGQRVLAAQTRYGTACLRFLSGEYAAAVTELERVRPELQRVGARPLLALADLDLAEVLLSIRLLPEALSLATSAARWFAAHAVPTEHARCLLVAGSALTALERPRPAARALERAARIFRAQSVTTGVAAVAVTRAQLALRRGEHALAVRHGRAAHRVFAAAGLGLRALSAGALTAEALLSSGQTKRARDLARHLRRLPARPGDAYSRARLARIEAAAAARQGDARTALVLYEEALAHARRTEAAMFVDEWRVGFLEGEPALLDEALGVLMARQPAPRASEVWRWLERAAGHRRPDARLRVPEIAGDVRRRAARLRQELEACYARLWQPHASGARRPEPAAARALELLATRRAPSTEHLRADGVHIRYFSAGGRLSAIRTDASGRTLVRDLIDLGELERHVRLFHYQMEVLGSAAAALRGHRELAAQRAERHLAVLAGTVLLPVLVPGAELGQLRIAAHGPLFRIPWHALPWRGSPLVRHCVVTLEGPGAGAIVVPHRAREGAMVLGCDDAATAWVETEVHEVAATLSSAGVSVSEHVGALARRDAVVRAASGAALLHIAGHALYRAEHPEFSALRLHDGWLHARDLAELPLDGACVVLSACETGPHGAVAGDQMLGIVRGLAQAGARTMVTSLWKVDDRATLDFMKRLYQEWQRHDRLGLALTEVQRGALAAATELYGWAPFCLLGDPDLRWPEPHSTQNLLQHSGEGTYA